MSGGDDEQEEAALRATALQTMQSVLQARARAEQELLKTKEALEEETRVLELLNRTGALLASRLALEEVVQAVTDAGTELSGAEFGAFFYTVERPEGGEFVLFTLSGAPREAFEKFGHPRATALFGPTFRGEAVIRIADVKKDPRYGQFSPHHGMPPGHLPVSSYLAVPVVSAAGVVLGGLFFGHQKPGVFTERAERLIVGLAAQAAIALDNARLYEEARRSAAERSQLLDAERAARAEVERVSLMKDEFLATLSHELRTPLNAILGWAEMLLRRASDEDRRGLDAIGRNARAQAQLIDDLLDMNRIVSGKIRLDVQRLDLAQAIASAIDAVRPSADAKGIRIRSTIDPDPGPVFGDPSRLQQVVWNLLSNAVKFTQKRGTIDVVVQRVNSHVEIIVHDTGIGIEPDFLPHLFERFRQADSSSTRRYGGLGLGLSIVKQLVELHGGTITATSPGLDQGATFVVSLPVRPVREVSSPGEHPTSGRGSNPDGADLSLEGVDVLVVDDERDARDILEAVLGEARATVRTASSATDALAMVLAAPPDVVVSDIGMPDRDGYHLMREIRSLPSEQGGRVPAIALTAFARSEDRTRAMIAGYQVHVSKPIEPAELVATIRSLVDHVGRKGTRGA